MHYNINSDTLIKKDITSFNSKIRFNILVKQKYSLIRNQTVVYYSNLKYQIIYNVGICCFCEKT